MACASGVLVLGFSCRCPSHYAQDDVYALMYLHCRGLCQDAERTCGYHVGEDRISSPTSGVVFSKS